MHFQRLSSFLLKLFLSNNLSISTALSVIVSLIIDLPISTLNLKF